MPLGNGTWRAGTAGSHRESDPPPASVHSCVTQLMVHKSGQVRFAWAGAMHPQLRACWQSKEVTFPDVAAPIPTTGSWLKSRKKTHLANGVWCLVYGKRPWPAAPADWVRRRDSRLERSKWMARDSKARIWAWRTDQLLEPESSGFPFYLAWSISGTHCE